jgi:5-methylcytosine-specific restriction endonuclease McrA
MTSSVKRNEYGCFAKGNKIRLGAIVPKGKEHWSWKPRTEHLCPICSKLMLLCPWEKNRKFCSLKCRGLGKRDVNSPVYKGEHGSKRIRVRIMDMPEYKEWRTAVFRRDGWKCTWCGSKKNIEADHVHSLAKLLRENEIKTPAQARRCPTVWDVANGRTLCRECHRTTDSYLKRT